MMKAAIAAAIMLLAQSANEALAAEQCGLKLLQSYDMEPGTSLPVIQVSIDAKPRPTMIDTGAFSSWVTQSYVNEIGEKAKSLHNGVMVYGENTRMGEYIVVPSVDIGAFHQDASTFTIMAHSEKTKLAAGLGHNALKRFDVEFDFAARKVKFFSQDHCEGQVVYWTKNYTAVPFKDGMDAIELSMVLDGHDIDTVLDTGTTYSYLNRRIMTGIFELDDNSPNVKHVTLPGDYKTETATFKSLSIGGVTFPNPSLLIREDQVLNMARFDVNGKEQNQPGVVMLHDPHLLLGMDALSHLHFYIAYGEHKIYVTAADAH